MKKLAILGSTGSIGTQTLEVVRDHGGYEVVALSAAENIDLLEKQIRETNVGLACVYNEVKAEELKKRVSDLPVRIVSGMEGLTEVASCGADMVLTAVVGMVGIRPTLAAIEAGADIALANKETLVTAGELVTAAAKRKGVKLLPVDSEHSAIYQCIAGRADNEIDKIILTCSGGPFRGRTLKEMEGVTVADALAHPNWSMGKKITIDSATLVNKALEVMEAGWLFDVALDDIEVVLQPGSIVHSAVQYADGAVIAQLGTPDMKLPISYALYQGERKPLSGSRLDFKSLSKIVFEEPDRKNFPALDLGLSAGKTGGTMPTVFNAANEWAVHEFLSTRIGFLDIVRSIESAMKHISPIYNPTIEDILSTEREAIEFLKKR